MKEQNTKVLDTITTVLAVALVIGLLVAPAIQLQQQAEAKGCPLTSPAANASKTRCFHP
jgi:hypothetical protein